jgi:hypothetical protein
MGKPGVNQPAQTVKPGNTQPTNQSANKKAPSRSVLEGKTSGPQGAARKQVIIQRRSEVIRERIQNKTEIVKVQTTLRVQRDQFRKEANFRPRYSPAYVRGNALWANRYASWYFGCEEPLVVAYNLAWFEPMPAAEVYSYDQVEVVSTNLEDEARVLYQNVSQLTNDPAVLNALAQLVDATEYYTDAVYAGSDYSDTLNNLFYVDSTLTAAEQVLQTRTTNSAIVTEVGALRYYVNKLLWSYRQNY